MNCSAFEKRIYLYRELTLAERKITDDHLSDCESCRAMAALLVQQQERIEKAKSIKPVINDPERLMRRIVATAARKDQPESQFDGIKSLLDHLFVRYAFSAISLLLITFLYIETHYEDRLRGVAKVEIRQGTILNTSNFIKMHLKSRQSKEKTVSISRYSYHRSERSTKTL